MNLDDLNLDALSPMLPIPMWQKLVALAVVFVLIIVSYIYLGWMPLQASIEAQQQQVEMQRVVLKRNQMLARDLPKKREEFAKLESQLKIALNMLPKQSQIPDLLENVSWAGTDSGLEFAVFTPRPERVKQIYAEVPVAVDMTGSFRQLLTFLKRVGEMPRIVSVRDLNMQTKGSGLAIQGSVMTYRFVDEPPSKVKNKKARKK